ncbi:MAG: adenosylhomocysteinase [Candidatus Muiribacteriota bacterium]
MLSQAESKVKWARKFMPVLEEIEERFVTEKIFEGKKIGMCLHITPETAYLCKILTRAGAEIMITAANPLSSQPDIVEYLKKQDKVKVLGFRGMNAEDIQNSITDIIKWNPDYVMDDGAELVIKANELQNTSLKGATEETATGYYKLLKYEDDNLLKLPVIATSFSFCHNLFDNKHGTAQSVIDGIIRATNSMLAGKTVVTVGYGECGATFARKIEGMGANVIVCEVNPQRALEAALDGYRVLPFKEAAIEGDIFCTFTGNLNVISKESIQLMKDNVILCNAGHYNIEIDMKGLEEVSKDSKFARANVIEYILNNGKRINLLAEGRIVNMTAAEGHPAAVMDISFALQLLALELFLQDDGTLQANIYEVPEYIDESIANLKLMSLGIKIDNYTHEQLEYIENN